MGLKDLEGAIQMLVWAIEEIAKTDNKQAEHHARLALTYLQPQDAKPKFGSKSTVKKPI